jgi:hypothetical protein
MKQEKLIAFLAILIGLAAITGCSTHANAETREERVLAVLKPLIEEHYFRNGAVPSYDQIKRRATNLNDENAPRDDDEISIGEPKAVEEQMLVHEVPVEVKSKTGSFKGELTLSLVRRGQDWWVVEGIENDGELKAVDDPINHACAVAFDFHEWQKTEGKAVTMDDFRAAAEKDDTIASTSQRYGIALEGFVGKADASSVSIQPPNSNEELVFRIEEGAVRGVVSRKGGA